MFKKNSSFLVLLTIIFICFIMWYFSELVFIILISVILSLFGQPLIRLFDRIRFRTHHFPHTLSTILSLIIMICFFAILFFMLIPPVAMQIKSLSGINIATIQTSLKEPLNQLQSYLVSYHLMPQGQNLDALLGNEIIRVFNKINLMNTFTGVVSFAGKVIIDTFCVLFITFFFLKDEHLFYKSIMLFTPNKYRNEMEHVLSKSKQILSRYFIGLLIEMLLVFTIISFGLTILGIKMALLIGFFAGIMVIVPYIGIIISLAVAVVLCITGNLNADFSSVILPAIYKTFAVFAVAKIIDDFLLQPLIYSNSVKAHPLEIFIVIIISGTLAGVVGMMLAVPAYTLIRIVASEFLSNFNIVKKLTEKI